MQPRSLLFLFHGTTLWAGLYTFALLDGKLSGLAVFFISIRRPNSEGLWLGFIYVATFSLLKRVLHVVYFILFDVWISLLGIKGLCLAHVAIFVKVGTKYWIVHCKLAISF